MPALGDLGKNREHGRPIQSLLAAPDPSRWGGLRDKTLMLLAIQTGLWVSEFTGLNCRHAWRRSEHLMRRQRTQTTSGSPHRLVEALPRVWLDERAGLPHDPLFPTRTARRLSRDAVALPVSTYASTVTKHCPTLAGKRVHPHLFRHSCAMSLLQADVRSTDA